MFKTFKRFATGLALLACVVLASPVGAGTPVSDFYAAQATGILSPGGLGYPTPFFASGSYTVPPNVHRVLVLIWGGAGSGGCDMGGTTASATGGATGGYAQAIVNVTPGEVDTVTVGAGGSGPSCNPSSNGNSGGTSSYAATSKTVSCTGGGGGTHTETNGVTPTAPAGGTCSNADTTFPGGVPGTQVAATGNFRASGGAAASGPWGIGASSGTATGTTAVATGGAGPMGPSGNASGTTCATGGGGYRGSSGNCTGTSTFTGGGAAFASSAANSATAGTGDSTAIIFSQGLFPFAIPTGAGSNGTTSGSSSTPQPGGGSGAASNSANFSSANGGFMGGSGAIESASAVTGTVGFGGWFAGGGACAEGTSLTCTPGGSLLAGAGGGGVGNNATSSTAPSAGGGLVIVQPILP